MQDSDAFGRGESARVIIIGGGVFGASIAWHLSCAGVSDVVVLERNAVGSGASARAAGLVSLARGDRDVLRMVRGTLDDMQSLSSETSACVEFHASGSLRIADRAGTAGQFQRMADMLTGEGVASAFLDAAEARALAPWLDAADAAAIMHLPGDGYVDGQGLAIAYARAAAGRGVRIHAGTGAIAPVLDATRVVGVETTRGAIACEWLIDAAGTWAGTVLGWFGRSLGATALRSHYWITAPVERPMRSHPVVVLPDARAYLRPEVDAMLLGVQEPASRSFDDRSLPEDLDQMALTDSADWDLLARHASELKGRIPGIEAMSFPHHLAGLTTYTPDGRFLIGAMPGLEGLILAGGCCGTGVSVAGGVGRIVRDLVTGRTGGVDLEALRPDRFGGVDTHAQPFVDRCVAARANKGQRA